jgi:hypothetical protein
MNSKFYEQDFGHTAIEHPIKPPNTGKAIAPLTICLPSFWKPIVYRGVRCVGVVAGQTSIL